jgi:hypothetical protein
MNSALGLRRLAEPLSLILIALAPPESRKI